MNSSTALRRGANLLCKEAVAPRCAFRCYRQSAPPKTSTSTPLRPSENVSSTIRPSRQSLPAKRYASTTTATTTAPTSALNLPKWLEENSHLLKPPINNHCIYNDDITVMIVGGPNARTDYHINNTTEFFYQYRGSMLLKIVSPSLSTNPDLSPSEVQFHDVPIREGELYVLPPNTPHNPIRFANTVGIVLEQPRPGDSMDKLRWYCRSKGCEGRIVYEESFHCTDLGTQIKEAVQRVGKDEELRRCKSCGEVVEMVPKGVVQP